MLAAHISSAHGVRSVRGHLLLSVDTCLAGSALGGRAGWDLEARMQLGYIAASAEWLTVIQRGSLARGEGRVLSGDRQASRRRRAAFGRATGTDTGRLLSCAHHGT